MFTFLLGRLLVSGGREGAVRVWDAAGAEGADVLAALGAGAGAQVLFILFNSFLSQFFSPGGWAWMDRHKQRARLCCGKSSRCLNSEEGSFLK